MVIIAMSACRFVRLDAIAEQPALLQLLREVQANKVVLDVGGDRALPDVLHILAALQRAAVPWVFVKSEALLQAALDHLRLISPVPSLRADSTNGRGSEASGASQHDVCPVGCLRPPSVQAGAAAAAPHRTQQSEHSQRLPANAMAMAQQHDTHDTLAGCQQAQRHARRRQRQAKWELHSAARTPTHVLWRWRKQSMPRAWDLGDAAAARAQGLVRESLAVVPQGGAWLRSIVHTPQLVCMHACTPV